MIFNEDHFIFNVQLSQDGGHTIQTVQSVDSNQDNMTVDLTEATLGQDGQIIITGEDGHGMIHTIIFVFPNSRIEIIFNFNQFLQAIRYQLVE